MNSLKSKTINGLFWSSFENFSVQGIKLIISIFIARILDPSDYGLIGMLAIFLAISQIIIDGGFSSALIQNQNSNSKDFSTNFYFNILVAIFFYIILFFNAPFIANFFNQPKLIILTRVLSLNLILLSFSITFKTLLTRDIDFKTQTYISLISSILGGIAGLIIAYKGFGYWALVFQILITNAITAILYFIGLSWKPQFVFSFNSLKMLFKYGSKLLIANLIYTVFDNLYLFLIGKFFSASTLGFYVKARNFANLPTSNLNTVIQRVTFPALSRLQLTPIKLYKNFRKVLRLTAFLSFPLLFLIVLISYPAISILLTNKWIESAKILQILAFSLVWFPINELNITLLKVHGDTGRILKLEIWKKSIAFIIILITLPFGFYPLLYGQIIVSLITVLINASAVSFNNSYYNIFTQLKDILLFLFISFICAIPVYFLQKYIDNMYLHILLSSSIYMILYFILIRVLNIKELLDFKLIIQDYIKS